MPVCTERAAPGGEADARLPWGELCVQPWAFVLLSQVFPLNEAQGRVKSQLSLFFSCSKHRAR